MKSNHSIPIKDPKGHLVCMLNDEENIIEIKRKDYLVMIHVGADGKFVTTYKKAS